MNCSKDSLCQKLKETSERLVELEREREVSGGQFVPTDRDYFCTEKNFDNLSDSQMNDLIEDALKEERSRFNCEFLCYGLLKFKHHFFFNLANF